MSEITLPAEKIRAAMKAAADALDAEGDELAARFLKTRKWSWREFRYVVSERERYAALSRATDTRDGMTWLRRKQAFNDAASALLPLCKVAETVNVSAEHFKPIANFYR